MQLSDIALNNLRRRKGKMAFLVCGMVFAIATIVTLYTITSSMDAGVSEKFEEMGTKVLIVPSTNSVVLSYGGITIPSRVSYDVKEIEESDLEAISSVKGEGSIKTISPKVLGAATVNSEKTLVVGVDFAAEAKVRPYWTIDGELPVNDNEVLLGWNTAAKFNLQAGQQLSMSGPDEESREFKVTGIVGETGSEEDGLIFGSLQSVQRLLDKEGKLSFIELNVDKDEKILAGTVQELGRVLPDTKIKTVKEAVESRKEIVDRFGKFSLVVSGIMVLIGTIMIVITMLSAVNERTREIGIFRAIGFRKSHIIKIILLEAGIVSGLSGILGYLAGFGVALLAAPKIAQMDITVAWSPTLTIAVIVLSVVVGLLASLYPASRATKLDPAEALRFM